MLSSARRNRASPGRRYGRTGGASASPSAAKRDGAFRLEIQDGVPWKHRLLPAALTSKNCRIGEDALRRFARVVGLRSDIRSELMRRFFEKLRGSSLHVKKKAEAKVPGFAIGAVLTMGLTSQPMLPNRGCSKCLGRLKFRFRLRSPNRLEIPKVGVEWLEPPPPWPPSYHPPTPSQAPTPTSRLERKRRGESLGQRAIEVWEPSPYCWTGQTKKPGSHSSNKHGRN